MTWERIEHTEQSGELRTDGGELSVWPEIKLGQPLIILGPPIRPFTYGRIIMTSDIVGIMSTLGDLTDTASAISIRVRDQLADENSRVNFFLQRPGP
jgi:hypothetical protein